MTIKQNCIVYFAVAIEGTNFAGEMAEAATWLESHLNDSKFRTDVTAFNSPADMAADLAERSGIFARKWTETDGKAIELEGWCLSERSDGRLEIQRCDETESFPDDMAALKFVEDLAKAGSSIHAKALALDRTKWK